MKLQIYGMEPFKLQILIIIFFFSDAAAKSPEIWSAFALLHEERRGLKEIFIDTKAKMEKDDPGITGRSLELK